MCCASPLLLHPTTSCEVLANGIAIFAIRIDSLDDINYIDSVASESSGSAREGRQV